MPEDDEEAPEEETGEPEDSGHEEDTTEKPDTEEEEAREEPEKEVSDNKDSGTLDSVSGGQALAVGGILGLVIGLGAGAFYGMQQGGTADIRAAESNLRDAITAGGFNGTVNTGTPDKEHGMLYYNVTIQQETPNGTQTGNQPVYMSNDGVLLFPVIQPSPFIPSGSPINLEETRQQTQTAQ